MNIFYASKKHRPFRMYSKVSYTLTQTHKHTQTLPQFTLFSSSEACCNTQRTHRTFNTKVDFLSKFGESKQILYMERQKEQTTQPNAYWLHTQSHTTSTQQRSILFSTSNVLCHKRCLNADFFFNVW